MSKYYGSISSVLIFLKLFKKTVHKIKNKNFKRNCLLKHCKIWKHAWPIKALKAAPMSRKLAITRNAKTCSKQKKVLEIRKVAKKLPSNWWQALELAIAALKIKL